MKKKWLVALYKAGEVKRLERNLLNQKFDYYLPKISIRKINSNPKVEILFPGYIFVNTSLENYASLKYTIGIKNIIKFGNNISCISHEEIKSMQMVEQASKTIPISQKIHIGQDALISKGSLKGSMVKICSLPSKERVEVFLSFLGSTRRVNMPIRDIIIQ